MGKAPHPLSHYLSYLTTAPAAFSIAAITFAYPVQRHRLPASACWISAKVGVGCSSSSMAPDRIRPGVQ